jgi:hypothetical protein
MNNEKSNINNVRKRGKQITILEGGSTAIQQSPQDISGNIDAPSRFIEGRNEDLK